MKGKVALVSGGARGLGAAYVRGLHEQGAVVVIGDVLDEQGRELAEELGERVHFVHLDVTQEQDWAEAAAVAKGLGGVHVLVNNAGIANSGRIEKYEPAQWHAVIAVNLTGVYLGVRAVVGMMKDGGGGSIINISSVQGLRGGVACTGTRRPSGVSGA